MLNTSVSASIPPTSPTPFHTNLRHVTHLPVNNSNIRIPRDQQSAERSWPWERETQNRTTTQRLVLHTAHDALALTPHDYVTLWSPIIRGQLKWPTVLVGMLTLFRMISGATYSGVPQNVHVLRPGPIALAKPKSTCKENNKTSIQSTRQPYTMRDTAVSGLLSSHLENIDRWQMLTKVVWEQSGTLAQTAQEMKAQCNSTRMHSQWVNWWKVLSNYEQICY